MLATGRHRAPRPLAASRRRPAIGATPPSAATLDGGSMISLRKFCGCSLFWLAAFLNSYAPANLATNYLGDSGFSGNPVPGAPGFFQVIVPSTHHLVLVLNETTPNGGLNFVPTDLLVEAFTDTEFTDLIPRAVP